MSVFLFAVVVLNNFLYKSRPKSSSFHLKKTDAKESEEAKMGQLSAPHKCSLADEGACSTLARPPPGHHPNEPMTKGKEARGGKQGRETHTRVGSHVWMVCAKEHHRASLFHIL